MLIVPFAVVAIPGGIRRRRRDTLSVSVNTSACTDSAAAGPVHGGQELLLCRRRGPSCGTVTA
jgi:hypothetical protein